MIKSSTRKHSNGQWSLVGLLVTIMIIAIVAAIYYPKIAARHSAPGAAATPTERAYGVGCEEYVSQMNQAVTMYKMDHDDKPPGSFEDLMHYGVTKDMIHSDGCYFVMDPDSGNVTEVGHGRYQPKPVAISHSENATGFHPDNPDAQSTHRSHFEFGEQGDSSSNASTQTGAPSNFSIGGPSAAPPSNRPANPSSSSTTSVMGPGGMSIKVPSSSGADTSSSDPGM